jgi:hypothetical protein
MRAADAVKGGAIVTAILVPILMVALLVVLLVASILWEDDPPTSPADPPFPQTTRTVDGSTMIVMPEDLDRVGP